MRFVWSRKYKAILIWGILGVVLLSCANKIRKVMRYVWETKNPVTLARDRLANKKPGLLGRA